MKGNVLQQSHFDYSNFKNCNPSSPHSSFGRSRRTSGLRSQRMYNLPRLAPA